MWTHLVVGASHVRANKGGKPAIRDFLRRVHQDTWFAAIADTGQKHILPWTPVNAPGSTGRVLFEEAFVTLPRDASGWHLVDVLADALTDGATKEELGTGAYGARAWQLLGAGRIRAVERVVSTERGGTWFDLALWLAQRDEQKVAARLAAEKEAKHGRGRKGTHADANGGGDARATRRVSRDTRVQRAEALGPATGQTSRGRAKQRDAGRVGHIDDAHASTGGAENEQLNIFPRAR
jgi:hypothetical protein